MGKKCRGLRANWTNDMMEEALALLRRGESQRSVENRCGIPRRTLRNHLKTGSTNRKLGGKTMLTEQQEKDLEKKIIRLAEKGFPLTPKRVRKCVFKYVEDKKIPHRFSQQTKLAGRDWYRAFMKRHPRISQRKAQSMNPARAQKLNPAIVSDYFNKLSEILDSIGIKNEPSKIYNMDEKGCRLTLHHQQTVLAQKGARRVHLVAPEHAENVTVVACANALGNVIPPMILFKGQRSKPTFSDGLPHGSIVAMTQKGSMTAVIFTQWLQHFSKYMSEPPVLLIFDGAASHLDISIADKAEELGIHLLCLPSNTTHELQPMDKSVFRAFEHYWDQELLFYWDRYPERKLNKERFSDVFTPVWNKCMSIENIVNGFRATGIFPFNKNAIPVQAYDPSLPTHRVTETGATENNVENLEHSDPEENIPLALLREQLLVQKENMPEAVNSFQDHLITPQKATEVNKAPRKKALNYKAQKVTRQAFEDRDQNKSKQVCSSSVPGTSKTPTEKAPTAQEDEPWFCVVCQEELIADMRKCVQCGQWVHEMCMGFTADDDEDILCPDCIP